ncbi:MAG: VPLPA-CTERM-specific exosortase XrtD [Candidatus Sulfotelmatobacter sp.]
MSQLVESESLVAHTPAQREVKRQPTKGTHIKPALPYWQAAILVALSLGLYGPTIYHLVLQWAATDSDFSHGFFVPLFSAFVLWQERRRLSEIIPKPAWSGLALVACALCVLIVGQLGAELFLARISMLLLIAGLVVLFLGWNFFRAVFFPWAFLFLMIPIPTLLYNQITFPLQLLASQVAADVLQLLNVPVLREGNVITLPNIVLEVAQACSGIRSLMSLTCLAIIYGYLMERRITVRWALALISLPIAVAANSARIIGTGLMAHYWDPEKAQGFYHIFEGWLVFVACLLLLYFAHLVINAVWPDRGVAPGDSRHSFSAFDRDYTASWPRFLFALVLFACAVLYLKEHNLSEVFPPHQPLESFPAQLGPWNGTDLTIDQETRDVLGPGEFLSRSYNPSQNQSPSIELFIAYFPSQRTGDTIHSPMHCLPGSGWLPLDRSQVTLSLSGHGPFPANRVVIAKGELRDVVLYWYWAHDRGVASEYSAKYYLIKDSIKLHRSDGALVRIITPIYPGEDADAAYQRILPFAGEIVPRLDDYIPR